MARLHHRAIGPAIVAALVMISCDPEPLCLIGPCTPTQLHVTINGRISAADASRAAIAGGLNQLTGIRCSADPQTVDIVLSSAQAGS
jgi:hypothetical protein